MFKLRTLAAIGVGYLLGTRDGRERYQQIQQKAREFMGRPEVQQASDKAKGVATQAVGTVKSKASGGGSKTPEPYGGDTFARDVVVTDAPVVGSPVTPGVTHGDPLDPKF